MSAETEERKTMRNAIGQDIPVHMVKEVDKLRDDLVMDLVRRYGRERAALAGLRKHAETELSAFLDLSAERYNEDIGGKKGNVTLYSYDGRYKVMRKIQDNLVFDEGFAAGKALIDQYLTDALENAPGDIRQIVERAFRPNAVGRISTSAVLGLRTLAINDPRWIKAMHAISESVKVISSKAHVHVYRRDEFGEWQPITVDFAGL